MEATELLTKDHRHVEDLFAKFRAADSRDRRELLAEIIRELSIHEAIEEAYLYPLVRKSVPRGDLLIDDSIKQHQRVKEGLGRLDGMLDKAHTQEVAHHVDRLEREVEHHVHEEETEVFPALARSTTKTELNSVGRELRDAKDSAPTRPHPNQLPANQLTAWANGLVDRMRDRVGGRA